MTNYDVFAPFYDETMRGGGNQAMPITSVKQWLNQYHPQARSLLEVACGTGTVLKQFEGFYELAGLDLSPEMIKLARVKVSGARLWVADMANFELDATFDTVICLFDSINHLPEFWQWEGLFAQVYQHLNPGGLFVFDMNSIGRLQQLIAQPTRTWRSSQRTVRMQVEPGVVALTDWTIQVFEHKADGSTALHEDYISETSFELGQVRAALERRFDILEVAVADESRPTQADRVYFVCRKRAA